VLFCYYVCGLSKKTSRNLGNVMVISNNIEKIISLKNGHIKVFVNSFKKTIP